MTKEGSPKIVKGLGSYAMTEIWPIRRKTLSNQSTNIRKKKRLFSYPYLENAYMEFFLL